MCVTIKDNILKENDNITVILAFSIYDTNPANILSNVTENITWTKKIKIWDKTKNKFDGIGYLRLNMIGYYNYEMKDI